ncbi:unnamed protein product [Amoebophrya sp. A25]|nr:unnamed protein product [Amoebophrya sp. A25]|eukprot:GSA25T00018603001.1
MRSFPDKWAHLLKDARKKNETLPLADVASLQSLLISSGFAEEEEEGANSSSISTTSKKSGVGNHEKSPSSSSKAERKSKKSFSESGEKQKSPTKDKERRKSSRKDESESTGGGTAEEKRIMRKLKEMDEKLRQITGEQGGGGSSSRKSSSRKSKSAEGGKDRSPSTGAHPRRRHEGEVDHLQVMEGSSGDKRKKSRSSLDERSSSKKDRKNDREEGGGASYYSVLEPGDVETLKADARKLCARRDRILRRLADVLQFLPSDVEGQDSSDDAYQWQDGVEGGAQYTSATLQDAGAELVRRVEAAARGILKVQMEPGKEGPWQGTLRRLAAAAEQAGVTEQLLGRVEAGLAEANAVGLVSASRSSDQEEPREEVELLSEAEFFAEQDEGFVQYPQQGEDGSEDDNMLSEDGANSSIKVRKSGFGLVGGGTTSRSSRDQSPSSHRSKKSKSPSPARIGGFTLDPQGLAMAELLNSSSSISPPKRIEKPRFLPRAGPGAMAQRSAMLAEAAMRHREERRAEILEAAASGSSRSGSPQKHPPPFLRQQPAQRRPPNPRGRPVAERSAGALPPKNGNRNRARGIKPPVVIPSRVTTTAEDFYAERMEQQALLDAVLADELVPLDEAFTIARRRAWGRAHRLRWSDPFPQSDGIIVA